MTMAHEDLTRIHEIEGSSSRACRPDGVRAMSRRCFLAANWPCIATVVEVGSGDRLRRNCNIQAGAARRAQSDMDQARTFAGENSESNRVGTRVLLHRHTDRNVGSPHWQGPFTAKARFSRELVLDTSRATRAPAEFHEQSVLGECHGLAQQIWAFMRTRRKYWLWPIFVMMALLGVLIVLAQGSVVAPFIYTLSERVLTCVSSGSLLSIMTALRR